MEELFYRFLAAGFQAFIWGGEVTGEENLPDLGAGVLVANHLGALGPIALVACVPRRLYPWVAADVMDSERAPEYLRQDFVEKELHLVMPLSLWLAKIIAKISVPLLNGLGCIPVYPNPNDLPVTFDQTVDLLVRGHFVVVFPEDPTRPLDPQFKMSPFKKGFVRLGELYFQRVGRPLKFYPLAVHTIHRIVQIGKPVTFNPYAPPVMERIRVKGALESMIREMLAELDGSAYLGIPLTH